LDRHRRAVLAELERLATERADGLARGYLQPLISPTRAASFRRAELHVRAELEWHDECDRLLTAGKSKSRTTTKTKTESETRSPESAE